MSRIGKKAVELPEGIEAKLEKNRLEIKGPKGSLVLNIHREARVNISGSEIRVEKTGASKKAPAIWGLTRALIASSVEGVRNGYKKQLELQGVGFRMAVQSRKMNLALGFSHPVVIEIPEGIEAKITSEGILEVTGIDKQKVGQFAADIRRLKPAEPYKGKGFRYAGEYVRRKAGKKAAAK